jgi:hypothetical protein
MHNTTLPRFASMMAGAEVAKDLFGVAQTQKAKQTASLALAGIATTPNQWLLVMCMKPRVVLQACF